MIASIQIHPTAVFLRIAAFSFFFLSAFIGSSKDVPAGIDKSGKYQSLIDKVIVNSSPKYSTGTGTLGTVRFDKHKDYERIVLDFVDKEAYSPVDKKGTPSDFLPKYWLTNEGAPNRIVFEFQTRNAIGKLPDLAKSTLVRRCYTIPTLDDAGARFVIEFKKDLEFEVFELHKPARLVIDVRALPEQEQSPVFVLRTKTIYKPGTVDQLEEMIMKEHGISKYAPRWRPGIVLTSDGKGYSVELAHSLRDWKAKANGEGYSPELRSRFFLEKRGINDMPKATFTPWVVKPQ